LPLFKYLLDVILSKFTERPHETHDLWLVEVPAEYPIALPPFWFGAQSENLFLGGLFIISGDHSCGQNERGQPCPKEQCGRQHKLLRRKDAITVMTATRTAQPVLVSRLLPTPRAVWKLLKGWWTKVYDMFFDLQLIHMGATYSIERMLALDEYTRSASVARVLFVTIGLPLFMVALILCQEIVPLQEPAAGWKANYGFWIRMGALGVAIAHLVASKIEPWLQVPALVEAGYGILLYRRSRIRRWRDGGDGDFQFLSFSR